MLSLAKSASGGKKFLMGVMLFVSIFLCLPISKVQASVIDEGSPWGVVVWNYTRNYDEDTTDDGNSSEETKELIGELMDSIVSLGCSWVRLTGFGGLNNNGDYDYSDDGYDWNDCYEQVDPWVDSAMVRGINTVLVTWPHSQSDGSDNPGDWDAFWKHIVQHYKDKGVHNYYIGIEPATADENRAIPFMSKVYPLDGHLIDRRLETSPPIASHPWAHRVVAVTQGTNTYAYVTCGGAGLWVVDVTEPDDIHSEGFWDHEDIGNKNGYAYGLAIKDGYAYVAEGSMSSEEQKTGDKPNGIRSAGIRRLDISATPILQSGEVSFNNLTGDAGWGWDVEVYGDYAYVADGYRGLRIVNINTGNPPDPNLFKESASWPCIGGGYTQGIAVGTVGSDVFAYLAEGTKGVEKIKVTDLSNMQSEEIYDPPGYINEIAVFNNNVYIVEGWKDKKLYVTGMDFDDPVSLELDAPGTDIKVTIPDGQTYTYAYVTCGKGGLEIIKVDLSNATTPLEKKSRIEFPLNKSTDYATGVCVVGNYAYVSTRNGLRVIDVSNPSSPAEKGFLELPANSSGLAYWDEALWIDDIYGWRGNPDIIDYQTASFCIPPNNEYGSQFLEQWYGIQKEIFEDYLFYVRKSSESIHNYDTIAKVIVLTDFQQFMRKVKGLNSDESNETPKIVQFVLPPYWQDEYSRIDDNGMKEKDFNYTNSSDYSLHPDSLYGIHPFDGSCQNENLRNDEKDSLYWRLGKYWAYHFDNGERLGNTTEEKERQNVDVLGLHYGNYEIWNYYDQFWANRSHNIVNVVEETSALPRGHKPLWEIEKHLYTQYVGGGWHYEDLPGFLDYDKIDGEYDDKIFIWEICDRLRWNHSLLAPWLAEDGILDPLWRHKVTGSGFEDYPCDTDLWPIVHSAIMDTKWDHYIDDTKWLTSDVQYSTANNNSRKIVADSYGNLHMVFTSTPATPNHELAPQIKYCMSTDNGQTWHDKRTIGDGQYPAIVVSKCPTCGIKEISVCWISADNKLHYRAITHYLDTELNPKWGEDIILHTETEGDYTTVKFGPPAMVVDKNNNVHLAMMVKRSVSYPPPGQVEYEIKYWKGPIDAAPVVQNSIYSYSIILGASLLPVSIDVDNQENLYVAFEKYLDITTTEIHYTTNLSGGWSTPVRISTLDPNCQPYHPFIDENNGTVFIAWEGMNTSTQKSDIYAVHFPVSTITEPYGDVINISNSLDVDSKFPVLTEGTKIVWQEDTDIYWADFDALPNPQSIVPEGLVEELAYFPQACVKYSGFSSSQGNIGTFHLIYTSGYCPTYSIKQYSEDIIVPMVYTGTLVNTQHWTTNVYIAGDITIDTGATLTIDPGVKVYTIPFYDDQHGGSDTTKAEIIVNGTLIANGAIFEADTTHNDSTTVNSWLGIKVNPGGSAEIRGCTVKDAVYGIYANGGSITAMNNYLTECSLAVYVNSNANLVSLGNLEDQNLWNKGMNSIYGNTWNFVNADTTDSVLAQANYWGTFDTTQLKISGLVKYTPFGIDKQGEDWIIASDTTIYGTYWNVGTFKINSSKTAKVAPKSTVTTGWIAIKADSFDIQGNFVADSAGWGPGEGPGAGTAGATAYGAGGAGHGGRGGAGGTTVIQGDTSRYGGCAYDTLENPCALGSGGGNADATYKGGCGAGIIRLISGGTINIAGTIRSDGKPGATSGGNKAAGGGSGGSVWLQGKTLAGNGLVSCRGGNGGNGTCDGGGGAGGRLNLWYEQSSFTGRVDVSGGLGYDNAQSGQMGTALIHQLDDSVKLVLSPVQTISSTDSRFGFINGVEFTDRYVKLTAGDSIVGNLKARAQDSIIINASSYIIADEKGYRHGQGIGVGMSGSSSHGAGGAGYGGAGGWGSYHTSGGVGDSGISYGDALLPEDIGSGGGDWADLSGYRFGGGNAGGAIELQCYNGKILLDGTLSINGSDGTSKTGYAGGGASGGSALIYAKYLTGTGYINANGGNGGAISNCYGGGGAGGRICLYMDSTDFDTTYNTTHISVAGGDSGGTGATNGNPGTIHYDVLPIEYTPVSFTVKNSPFIFKLNQNYPNPFRNKTTIQYSIASTCDISLKLYDLSGRCVKTLVEGRNQLPGIYKVDLNARDYPAGIYFAKYVAGKYRETKKLVLMR